jgi:predicted CXXCH cytochrome family protein
MNFRGFKPGRWKESSVWSVALALLGLVVMVGCTTEGKRRWLTVFFDGVPDPNAPKATNQVSPQFDEDGRPLAGAVFVKNTNFAAVKAPKFTFHPPYEEKKCTECHVSKFSVKMKGPQKKVCFECHDDFLEKIKFKHQPADNGECHTCHDPHGSPLPKMVKFTGKKACFECHDDFLENAKVKHTPADSGDCLSCHAPHGSTNKFMLIKPGKAMCFECHDDFLEKPKFQHTVATECESCHSSHKSDETALLIKSRPKLCLECHDEKDMAAVKGHAQIGNTACLTCHEPHVGENKFLLKAAALKAMPPGGKP